METFNNFEDFLAVFSSDKSCREYLINARWNGGKYICRACKQARTILVEKNGKQIIHCTGCFKQESATSGTILHGIRISIAKVFQLLCRMLVKEISSAWRASQELGMPYATTWGWMEKFRVIMSSLVDDVQKVEVSALALIRIIFRRSIDTPAERPEDTDDNGSEESNLNLLAVDDEPDNSITAEVEPAANLIATVFQGVSLKYVQHYMAQLAFRTKGPDKFKVLVQAILQMEPFGRKALRAYRSPDLINVPLLSVYGSGPTSYLAPMHH